MTNKLFINNENKEKIYQNIDQIISNNQSFLILDPLEVSIDKYFNKLNENKYNLVILNLREIEKSNIKYNPLLVAYNYYKSSNKDKAISSLSLIADEIFVDKQMDDSYWMDSCKKLFIALGLMLFESSLEKTLPNLYKLIANVDKVNQFRNTLSNTDVLEPLYIYGSGVAFAPAETRQSIISIFIQKLSLLISRDSLNDLLNTDLDMINYEQKNAIFIINRDEENYMQASNILSRVILNQIIYNYFTNKRPMSFIFLNFETIAYKGLFDNYYRSANERNIEFLIEVKNMDLLSGNITAHFDRYSNKDIIEKNTSVDEMIKKIDARIEQLKKENEFKEFTYSIKPQNSFLQSATFKMTKNEDVLKCELEATIDNVAISLNIDNEKYPILDKVSDIINDFNLEKLRSTDIKAEETYIEYGSKTKEQIVRVDNPDNDDLVNFCEDFLYEYLLKTKEVIDILNNHITKKELSNKALKICFMNEKSEFDINSYKKRVEFNWGEKNV